MIKLINLYKGILNLWFKIPQFYRFILVGGYNTLFSGASFYLLHTLLHKTIHYLLILILSHFITVTNSFITFKYFVFTKSNSKIHIEYIKTHISYLFYIFCNTILLYFSVNLFRFDVVKTQLTIMSILSISFYFIHKYFSFYEKNS